MVPTEAALIARARRSYELGRLRSSVRDSWAVIPIAAIGFLNRSQWPFVLAWGVFLFALVTAFSWRGLVWRRALWPGFVAGVFPLLGPSMAPMGSVCWIAGSCWPVCGLLCVASGFVAGAALGILAAGQTQDRARFILASGLIAGLTGAFGCALAGVAGVLGMIAGGLFGLLPAYFGLQLRRA